MAEERIKIAEIDIGVDKLVAKTGQVKKQIAQLTDEQKKLRDSTNGLKNASAEQLDQFTRNEIEMKKLKKENSASIKVLEAYINIQNQDIRTKNQARDANQKLIAIANELDATNEDQAQLLKRVNNEIDKNTEFIKKNASEYEKTKINIGNYKEGIKQALNETMFFGEYTQDAKMILTSFSPVLTNLKNEFKEGATEIRNSAKATEGLTVAQKAQKVATLAGAGAWKIFRAAMIATGVGAFVVILGSLVAYLATTQEGIDKVNRVLTPLKVIFQALLGVVQNFGKEIVDAFSNPKQLIIDVGNAIKQNLINRFAALGKMIDAVMNGDIKGMKDAFLQGATGVENVIDKVNKLGKDTSKFFKDAAAKGAEIQNIQENLNKSEAEYIKQQAKLKKEFEEQKKLAEDVTKPIAEREAAAERAIQKQEEIRKGTVKRLELEAQLLKLKQSINDTSDAEKAELARKLAEIDKAIEEEAAKTTESQNKLNSIRKEGQQKALENQKKAIDESIQAQKEELDLFLAQQGFKVKSIQEELNIAEQVSKQKLAILEAEYKAGKVSKTAYETEKLNIAQEFAEKQANAAVANAEMELQALKDTYQSRLKDNEFLNEELFKQEQNRLNKILDAERMVLETKYDEGLISHQEYLTALNQLEADNAAAQDELKAQRLADLRAKEAIDLENKRAIEAEDFNLNLERELQEYQVGYEKRKAIAMAAGADMVAFEKAEAQTRKEIEKSVQENKLNLASSTFGAMANLMGKESAAGKAFGIAQATIDTYLGINKALASAPPPFNFIQAAAVGMAGFKSVAGIVGTKTPKPPKAARGIVMDIRGRSHAQGGETLYDAVGNPVVEAEGGEKMVILKKEASQELAVLSALNQKHGGVSLSKPMSYANNGGAVPRTSPVQGVRNLQIDYDKMGQAVGDYVAQNIDSIKMGIPVNSINEMNNTKSFVHRGAKF